MLAVVAATACALTPTAAAAPTPSQPVIDVSPDAPFAPDEAIVRFEPGTGASERRAARAAAATDFGRPVRIPRAQVVEVDGRVQAAVRRLERQPGVAYAQPNYRYEALAVAPPDDSFFGELWGLSDFASPDRGVNALAAWEATRGDGQVIAVVDTGVDFEHPDLRANLWTNPGELEDGNDGDGNTQVDDVHGYDFVDLDGEPDDFNDHGTHVAGTAAAEADSMGVVGVAPEAAIMAVRVLDGDGSGRSDDIGEGIAYAAQEGADVINLSLGGPAGNGDQYMADAVAEAAAHDAVVVAAAGNERANNDHDPHSPCVLPPVDGKPLENLICVAAVDWDGNRPDFSNWGANTVHVGAPGVAIRSTVSDYVTRFEERFESGLGDWAVESPWEITDEHASQGSYSLADSPGDDYLPNTGSEALGRTLDLSGEVDCRMRFDVRLDTESRTDAVGNYVDRLLSGVLVGAEFSGIQIAGSTGGRFMFVEFPLAAGAGHTSVRPLLRFESNGDGERDGAHVDDLRLLCRDGVYGVGNYQSLDGTSMAAPHVAGVVALAQAAASDAGRDASPETIMDAVLGGVNRLSSLEGDTVTGGVVDACLAVGAARGTPFDCGAKPGPEADDQDPNAAEKGQAPVPPAPAAGPAPGSTPAPAPAPVPTPAMPPASASPPARSPQVEPQPRARPRLGGPRRVRVSRRGAFRYSFRAAAGSRGRIAIRTRRKTVLSRRRPARRAHVTVARRRFAVPDSGRVRLRLRLGRRQLRILRLNRRLQLRVTVAIRDDLGRRAVAHRRLVLVRPRR